MLNPTISLDLYRQLTDGYSIDFNDLLSIDSAELPALDYLALLEAAFEPGSPLSQALQTTPSVVSSSEIVFGSGLHKITLGLSGLSGIGSLQELIDAVTDPSGTGLFTSLSVVTYGVEVLSGSFTDSTISFASGGTELALDGQLTNSFADLLALVEGVESAMSNFDLFNDSAAQQSLVDMLSTYGISGLRLVDDGDTMAELGLATDRMFINILGAELAAEGTFPIGDFGDMAAYLFSLANAYGDDFSLAALPSAVLNGLTLTGADGVTHLDISGSFSAPEDFLAGTLRVQGTSGNDRDIADFADTHWHDYNSDGSELFWMADFDKVVFNLTGGNDEFQYYADTRQSALYWEAYEFSPVKVNGFAGWDDIDVYDNFYEYQHAYTIFTLDWTTGELTSEFLGDPVYDEGVFAGPTLRFSSVESFQFRSYGEIHATGDDNSNEVGLNLGPEFLSFDGAGGVDYLNLSNFSGDINDAYYDGITLEQFNDLFQVIHAPDGWYDVYLRSERVKVAELKDVEKITVHDDVADDDISVDLVDLVTLPSAVDLDGTPGSDLLIQASGGAGYHKIISGLTGEVSTPLWRALSTAEGLGDFTGDGVADIVFRNDFSNKHMVVDAMTGDTLELARPNHSFLSALDVTGDGTDAMLFQQGNGKHYIMNADGTDVITLGRKSQTFEAVGDLNGDGVDDMIFTRGTGEALWLDGSTLSGTDFGYGSGTRLVGIADLDGDGVDEVLFERNTGGKFATDDAGTLVRSFGRKTSDLVAVGDFDGDGGDDLVFRSGTSYTLVDGESRSVFGSVSSTSPLVGVTDANADLIDELLFISASEGVQTYDVWHDEFRTFGFEGDTLHTASATGLGDFDQYLI